MEHARKASAMEPGNSDYRSLVQRFESGGSWYEQRQAAYGYPVMGGGAMCNTCLKLCVLNAMCNLCCCGGGYGARGMYCC